VTGYYHIPHIHFVFKKAYFWQKRLLFFFFAPIPAKQLPLAVLIL